MGECSGNESADEVVEVVDPCELPHSNSLLQPLAAEGTNNWLGPSYIQDNQECHIPYQ